MGVWFLQGVRSQPQEACHWVASVMAHEGMGKEIQPRQGKDWGQVNPIPKLEG